VQWLGLYVVSFWRIVSAGLVMSVSGEPLVNPSGGVGADQGANPRGPGFKLGIITCEPNRRILSVVKNISPSGALIEVDNAPEIPDQFTLAIESEPLARICRVAWRKARQIAVNFEGAGSEVSGQEQGDNERQERRQAPRRNVNTTGWIRLDGSFATRECKVVNVSTAGVRLVIPPGDKMPDRFTLLFSKRGQGHQVRVIWRRANQIGAKFI
jgi:hypothetical protein